MGATHRGGARPRARDLVEATPDSRNRYVDLIRVASIGVVVIGHWMLAVLGSTTVSSPATTCSSSSRTCRS